MSGLSLCSEKHALEAVLFPGEAFDGSHEKSQRRQPMGEATEATALFW